MPAGAGEAVFELAWRQNWARYPTNDLDLVLIDPVGNVNDSGATSTARSGSRSPTRCPAGGGRRSSGSKSTAVGDNHGPEKDIYTFRAEADGKRLEKVRR